ncbi:MAG: hypothetical protein Q9225_000238 [Loekoesia sp. 1 TL-2023]
MAVDMKILLFGDQTTDPRNHLRDQLLAGRKNVLLNHFIQKVGTALKHEISQLSFSEQDGIPNFSSIDELTDRLSVADEIHPGVASALLCVSQLAKYLESACCVDQDAHNTSNLLVIGLCTGLLAAAAVASAPAPHRLIPLGVEVVLIAFRVGTYIHQTARQLDISHTTINSWSCVVGGTTEEDARDALANFHTDNASIPF